MTNRRNFLKGSAAISAGTALNFFNVLGNFSAQAADTTGYKALVCVFLFGGMDCHDTVLPYDQASYDRYTEIRSSLMDIYANQNGGSSRAREALLPLMPSNAADFNGREFALPPQMSALHGLFGQGNAALVGNVGPLLQPTTRTLLQANENLLPERLFSHNDQQSTWMTFAPEGAQTGWGGLFADIMVNAGANGEPIFTSMTTGGNVGFLTGNVVQPFTFGATGPQEIGVIATEDLPMETTAAIKEHFLFSGQSFANLYERDFADVSRVSVNANDTLKTALEGANPVQTPFPQSGLGAQLQGVANAIAARSGLMAQRQVFFVSIGGFDTHSAQANSLPGLQAQISDALAAFYEATRELGLENDVTTFTASDFGRTLVINGDGTDHGWGAHHFVVGGAVNGGAIYGDMPEYDLEHEQDAGNGRLIPSASIEQYAAALGSWFGLSPSELNTALPNLGSFPDGALGFL